MPEASNVGRKRVADDFGTTPQGSDMVRSLRDHDFVVIGSYLTKYTLVSPGLTREYSKG